MDQESEDLADAYCAGFKNGVEACAEYLENLAKGEISYINSLLYIGIAKVLRENVTSD